MMWTEQDLDEIIALKINNEIYRNQYAIDLARKVRKVESVYSRAVFKFMAELDLGPKWEQWAKDSPTLFLMSEYNEWNKDD